MLLTCSHQQLAVYGYVLGLTRHCSIDSVQLHIVPGLPGQRIKARCWHALFGA